MAYRSFGRFGQAGHPTRYAAFSQTVITQFPPKLSAWLVISHEFPGRRLLEGALVLPLAFPAYLLAYAYTDLLDHPGLVQTLLRDVTGWGVRDYWFPEIRSPGGAAAMLTFVLYPCVYLLARAAFISQGARAYSTARTLGHGPPWSAFLRISLPMARPAIAAGVLLACMETIADYGTVAYFGVQSLAYRIYQSWLSMADRAAAAELSFSLLILAQSKTSSGWPVVVLVEGSQSMASPARTASRPFDWRVR